MPTMDGNANDNMTLVDEEDDQSDEQGDYGDLTQFWLQPGFEPFHPPFSVSPTGG